MHSKECFAGKDTHQGEVERKRCVALCRACSVGAFTQLTGLLAGPGMGLSVLDTAMSSEDRLHSPGSRFSIQVISKLPIFFSTRGNCSVGNAWQRGTVLLSELQKMLFWHRVREGQGHCSASYGTQDDPRQTQSSPSQQCCCEDSYPSMESSHLRNGSVLTF